MVARPGAMRGPWFWILTAALILAVFLRGFAWLLHERRATVLPPLLQGVSFAGPGREANPAWTARLRSRFPLGSNAGALTSELAAEDFTLYPMDERANFKPRKTYPCTEIYEVRWRQNSLARLTSLAGYYFSVCI